MPLSARSLASVTSLQPSLQPLALEFSRRAEEAGIPVEIIQGARTPEDQDRLFKQGGVTAARAMESYHQYMLAFDAVPKAYLSLPDWNPSGAAWATLGRIGEALGLRWGGRWSTPDKPHFEWGVISINELKDYWQKFQKIMPITVSPTWPAIAMMVGLLILWRWVRKNLK